MPKTIEQCLSVSAEEYFDFQPMPVDVFNSKYALEKTEGKYSQTKYEPFFELNGKKETPGECFWRVATYIASAEEDEGFDRNSAIEIAKKWFWMMWNREMIPGGRIMYGAGNPARVSLINCTTAEPPQDSLESIYDTAKKMARALSLGEGIGVDVTKLRPEKMSTNNAAKTTSGAVSWMELYDSTTGWIAQQGRRGALLISIRITHPETLKFIKVKSDLNKINNANISLQITDDFMQAVVDDKDWTFTWENDKGEILSFETVKARDIMREIAEHSSTYAEPGLQFWDTARRHSNSDALGDLNYKICSTNACCVTVADWVLTDQGAFQVQDLIDTPFTAIVNGKSYKSKTGFFKSGENADVFKVSLSGGREFKATPNHRFAVTENGKTVFIELKDLKVGDAIQINDHSGISFTGRGNDNEGYLLGSLMGDGYMTDPGKLRPGKAPVAKLEFWSKYEKNPVAELALRSLVSAVGGRSDRTGHVAKFDDYYKTTLFSLANKYGITLDKAYSPKIERNTSSEFIKGFLRGWFDADGAILKTSQTRGIRLASTNIEWIQCAQRMLGRLGINSRIYKNRRTKDQTQSLMPDGRGGMKMYDVKQIHELAITRNNIIRYRDIIGFNDIDKMNALNKVISEYKVVHEDKFVSEVLSIDFDSKQTVYDVTVEDIHLFDLNGVVSHNSEQMLDPWGQCTLGHANWANLSLNPEEAEKEAEHRGYYIGWFLDNVVTKQIADKRAPLPESDAKIRALRRIGQGFTGMADYFSKVGISYDSEDANHFASRLTRAMTKGAYQRSMDAGKERGNYTAFNKEKLLDSQFIKNMISDGVIPADFEHMRNVCCTTVAPVGTGNLMVQGWANGVEPGIGFIYWRRTRISGAYVWYFTVNEFVFELIKDEPKLVQEIKDLVTKINAMNVGPERNALEDKVIQMLDGKVDLSIHKFSHLVDPFKKADLMGKVQYYIDSALSVTYNMPESTTVDQVSDLYIRCWRNGLKGVAIYREDPRNREPLIMFNRPKSYNYDTTKAVREVELSNLISKERVVEKRPVELHGVTTTVTAEGKKFYFTFNSTESGDLYEVFCTTNCREAKVNTDAAQELLIELLQYHDIPSVFIEDQLDKSAHQTSAQKITRLVSLGLRHHVAPSNIVEALEGVDVPMSSYIFHLRRLLAAYTPTTIERCGNCGEDAMIIESGCEHCGNCGWSKC